jgi:NAD(P)-dependent dehydrogenase (short-subunit alcohol dehydrogenase family)
VAILKIAQCHKFQVLKDKVVIVSGARRGLGFEISNELAERGPTDSICSRCMAGARNSTAKSGFIAITKHITLEYGANNIPAYALALCNISTEATFASMTLNGRKKAAKEKSRMRWGDPTEVAMIAASVASEDFAFATGSTIMTDRGTVML